MIKLSQSWITDVEKNAVNKILDSQIINMGVETREFERELAEFFNTPGIYVTCVNSATAALHLSLQALGIGHGDEVLVPSYTFVASFQAVSATGATPIPVDVDLDDAFINLDDAKKRITKNTKAIMPVLFAGCGSANGKLQKIYNMAKEHNLHVVEDAAHSFGEDGIAKRDGVLCFSFDPIKNITCSDGGCVVTKNKEITEKIKDARLLGVVGDTEARYSGGRSWDADTVAQGWRYHMNNICASIGRAQLSRFGEIKERRQKYSKMYIDGLSNIPNIQLLPINAETAVPHIFPIIVRNNLRNELKKFLYNNEIESGIQYKPNHLLTMFNKGYELPNAENLYRSILSIPLHPRLQEDDVSYVISKIKEFFEGK